MKTVAALALALCALALGSTPATAADVTAADVTAVGTWDMVAETPNGPMPSVLVLKKVEGKLKAEVDLAGMKRDVREETLEADVFKMKVMYDSVLYLIQTKITGGTMEGTWDGGGNSGTLKATRRP
jgi:hypothetical protein